MDRLQPPAEGDGWKWKNKVWLSRLPWPEWLRSYTDNILTHCCLMFHDVFINLDQERKGTGPVCELKSHKTWKGRFLRTSSNVFHVQQKILLFHCACLLICKDKEKKNSNMLKDEIYCFTFNAKCLLHVHEYEVLLIFYPVTILDFWWRHFWLYRKLSCTVCLFVCFLYYSLWDYFALQFCWHVEQSLI